MRPVLASFLLLTLFVAGCTSSAPAPRGEGALARTTAPGSLVTDWQNVTKRLEFAASPVIIAKKDSDAEVVVGDDSVRVTLTATWSPTSPASQTLLIGTSHEGTAQRSISGTSPLVLTLEAPELKQGRWSFGLGVPPGSVAVSQDVLFTIQHEHLATPS
jgi:hypothetical protein